MKPKANRASGSLDIRKDLIDEPTKLQLTGLLTTVNGDDSVLPELLNHCLNPETDHLAEYMKTLSQVSTALRKYCDRIGVIGETSFTVYVSVLAEIHGAVTRNPVRRMISSTLQSLPQRYHPTLIQQFPACLQRYISQASRRDHDLDLHRHVIDLIASYLENWPLGELMLTSVNESVLTFLSISMATFVDACCESESPTELTELTQNCHIVMKTTITVLQKCFHGDQRSSAATHCHHSVTELVKAVSKILVQSTFTTNCQSVAGMTLVALLKLMSGSENVTALITKSLLPHCVTENASSLEKPEQQIKEQLMNSGIRWNQLTKYCQLCICHGVLAMLDVDSLVCEVSPHTTLLDVMFAEIMMLQSSLTDSYSILAASRTLTLWTHSARQALEKTTQDELRQSLSGYGSVSQQILAYVWENWEHAIEGMRYQMKIIFENMIEMHIAVAGKDQGIADDAFILDVFHQLMSNSWHVRGKYSFLVTMVTYLGSSRILELHPTMPEDVLSAMDEQTTAPYASDLYEKLLQSHKQQTEKISKNGRQVHETWQQIWLPPVLKILNSSKLGSTLLVQYLLPRLLKNNPESLEYIISSLQTSPQETHLSVMITCLKVARSQGLLGRECNGDAESWHGVIPVSLLRQAICHQDHQISLQALSLICDSPKSTEVFTGTDFQLIQLYLECNVKNQSAATRHCIMSNIKKILSRIQEGGMLLWKQRHKEDTKNLLTSYKEFLEWLFAFAFSSMYCDACYPRRAITLNILTLLQDTFRLVQGKKEGVEFSFSSQWTPVHVQSILECLTDTYVGNREMAYQLLVNVPHISDKVSHLYKTGLDLANGCRPQDSVIAANILSLTCQCGAVTTEQVVADLLTSLQEHILAAKASLLQAAASYPMYGVLYCVRVILKDKLARESGSFLENYTDKIIQLCLEAASIVSPVVCNSSPEGYLPVDNEKDASVSLECLVFKNQAEVDNGEEGQGSTSVTVTPQMVLVCCWITMKEVSLLLGQLTQMSRGRGQKSPLLPAQQMTKIGDFFMDLLMNARHRGAFELSYNGFEQLCHKLWRNSEKTLNCLPKQWLQVLLSEMSCESPSSQLCATRRSAGIPFAFQAILNAEPVLQSEREHFRNAMVTLLTLAKGKTEQESTFTSQVHSLNVLCALYRDSQLGEDVFPFIADGVKVAVVGFDSQRWAVRNSCMMLLNALVTRIFGVKRSKDEHSKKNQMSGREFFARFPSLHGFLLEHLKTVNKQTNNLQPSQFAILLILSRLYSSMFDGVDCAQSSMDFIPHIQQCCKSSVWKTRTIAARALASLTPTNKLVSMVTELIISLPSSSADATLSQNAVHGVLLQLHYLLQQNHSDHRLPISIQEELTSTALPRLADCFWLGRRCNRCYVTRAAYLQLIESSVLTSPSIPRGEFKNKITLLLEGELTDEGPAGGSPGRVLVEEQLAAITWKLKATDGNKDLDLQWLSNTMNSQFYEVRLFILTNLVKIFRSTSLPDTEFGKICKDGHVFSSLINMMLQETNPDCLSKVFEALDAHDLTLVFPWRPAGSNPWTCLQAFTFLQDKLDIILNTPTCGLPCSLVQLMSKLVPVIYEQAVQSSCADEHHRVFQKWIDTMAVTSSAGETTALKLTTAQSIVHVGRYLLHDPDAILGDASLSLWKSVIILLQEEEEEIRRAVTPAVMSSLVSEHDSSDVHCNIAMRSVFPAVIHLHGNRNWTAVFSFLLSYISEDGFALDDQEEGQSERLYDKGEANSYAETTETVQQAVAALQNWLRESAPLQPTQVRAIQENRHNLLAKMRDILSTLDRGNHCPFQNTSKYRSHCVFLYRSFACLSALAEFPLADQDRQLVEAVSKTVKTISDGSCGLNHYLASVVNEFTEKYRLLA